MGVSSVGFEKTHRKNLHKTPTIIRCNNKSTMYTYFPKFGLLKSLSEDRVTTQHIRNKKMIINSMFFSYFEN